METMKHIWINYCTACNEFYKAFFLLQATKPELKAWVRAYFQFGTCTGPGLHSIKGKF